MMRPGVDKGALDEQMRDWVSISPVRVRGNANTSPSSDPVVDEQTFAAR